MMCILVIGDSGPVTTFNIEHFGHVVMMLYDQDRFYLRIVERKLIFLEENRLCLCRRL